MVCLFNHSRTHFTKITKVVCTPSVNYDTLLAAALPVLAALALAALAALVALAALIGALAAFLGALVAALA
jgi:hypothetical protein